MQEFIYYKEQGRMSDPGAFISEFNNLPDSIEDLVKVVQGLSIHVFWAERYGQTIPLERRSELQLRTMEKRLARTLELDNHPLTEARPSDKKLIGNCRDFSLLLVSMLRHQGIPARARCGFGRYFMPDHYEDHWVAEYWNPDAGRWIMVDAQLDKLQCKALKINFDTLDVPRDQFIVGGKAWQMCLAGNADPTAFGIQDMNGLGFIRGNLVRDLAALNKIETLPWDCWGIILKEQIDDPDDLTMLNSAAALTAQDAPDFLALQSCYETESRLRMNGNVTSFFGSEPILENLAV